MRHSSELISVYLDGEASVAERLSLHEHLAECERCRRELHELQYVRTAVRSLRVLDLPLGVIPGSGAATPLRKNRGFLVGVAAAAAALVIAAAALLTPPPATVSVQDLSSRFGARVSSDPAFSPVKVAPPAVMAPAE